MRWRWAGRRLSMAPGRGDQGAEVQAAPLGARRGYDLDALAGRGSPRARRSRWSSARTTRPAAPSRAPRAGAVPGRVPGHVVPVLDEAYFEYLPPGRHNGVALIRAGARARGDADVLQGLCPCGPAHRLSGRSAGPGDPARTGAVTRSMSTESRRRPRWPASTTRPGHLARRVAEVSAERGMVDAGLRSLGFDPLPSYGNFLLVELARRAGGQLNGAPDARGIIVRPTGPFGAPAALRITIGRPDENAECWWHMAAIRRTSVPNQVPACPGLRTRGRAAYRLGAGRALGDGQHQPDAEAGARRRRPCRSRRCRRRGTTAVRR